MVTKEENNGPRYFVPIQIKHTFDVMSEAVHRFISCRHCVYHINDCTNMICNPSLRCGKVTFFEFSLNKITDGLAFTMI